MSRIFVITSGPLYDSYTLLVRVPDELAEAYRTLFHDADILCDFDEEGAVIPDDVWEWQDIWFSEEDLDRIVTSAHARLVIAIMAEGKGYNVDNLRSRGGSHLDRLTALSQEEGV